MQHTSLFRMRLNPIESAEVYEMKLELSSNYIFSAQNFYLYESICWLFGELIFMFLHKRRHKTELDMATKNVIAKVVVLMSAMAFYPNCALFSSLL